MTGGMQTWAAAMRKGDFESAWTIARQCLTARDPATRNDPSMPYHRRWVWDGRPLDGRDVLVRCYHGLGDTIQFARYLPLLATRVSSLTVEAQPRLIGLLSTIPGVGKLQPFDRMHPSKAADDIEITELDLALRVAPHQVPLPYLRAAPAVLPPGTVGLCHRSGDWDEERSMRQDLLAPLCRLAPCLSLASEPSDLPVLNPQGCPFDIGITASLVAGCDLVITVDTMIAHLAGALGKRTWLLLKAEPDWRWAPDRTDSPWYPSIRLYVQPSPGNWTAVISRLVRDLATTRANCASRQAT
jgi:hypothetical protein